MHLGYFDEFGHNGLFVSRDHRSYKTHPVFGLGGFIVPADNARELSAKFRRIKEDGLKEEIDATLLPTHVPVEHWEKKGSSLFTSKNIEKYRQTRLIFLRVLKLLEKCNAQVMFYGQEKVRGETPDLFGNEPKIYDHTLKQLIKRLHWDFPKEDLMLVLDKQGVKERQEIFDGAASFMYSHKDAARLVEPPLEVESHLYQTIQCADWICAILGRISAYKFDPDFEEFSWAPRYFGEKLAGITTRSSKVLGLENSLNLKRKKLDDLDTCFNSQKLILSVLQETGKLVLQGGPNE